jgi:UDP-2,3-diacylglucosamine hydrolase
MTLSRRTFFISDIHLTEKQAKIADAFLHFLNQLNASTDVLYILGDLFEAWIGDDDQTKFHSRIIQALREVTDRKIPIYFLPGNRDFLIGQTFLKDSHCQLLKEEEKISLYGMPVLLIHGDTLCTLDHSYQKMRKLFQKKWLQRLFLSMPLSFRRKIANKLRIQSGDQFKEYATWMDVTQDAVNQAMGKHHVQYLIHGHTHRPAIHQFNLNNKNATRIVLGAWELGAEILVWDETGYYELKKLSDYLSPT